jgi:hypothetical protein
MRVLVLGEGESRGAAMITMVPVLILVLFLGGCAIPSASLRHTNAPTVSGVPCGSHDNSLVLTQTVSAPFSFMRCTSPRR